MSSNPKQPRTGSGGGKRKLPLGKQDPAIAK